MELIRARQLLAEIWERATALAEQKINRTGVSYNFTGKILAVHKIAEVEISNACEIVGASEVVRHGIARRDLVTGQALSKDDFRSLVAVFKILVKWRDDNTASMIRSEEGYGLEKKQH